MCLKEYLQTCRCIFWISLTLPIWFTLLNLDIGLTFHNITYILRVCDFFHFLNISLNYLHNYNQGVWRKRQTFRNITYITYILRVRDFLIFRTLPTLPTLLHSRRLTFRNITYILRVYDFLIFGTLPTLPTLLHSGGIGKRE